MYINGPTVSKQHAGQAMYGLLLDTGHMKKKFYVICLLLAWSGWLQAQPVAVLDDEGTLVRLAAPAQRIISLSPHLAENVYSAGAGNALIATVEFSDYPRKARSLPRIGTFNAIDLERIITLKPDLVLAWGSGNGVQLIEQLRRLGLTVFVSEPLKLDDIPSLIERLGILAGTTDAAWPVASLYRQTIDGIRSHHRGKRKVSVFYQIWDAPLMTINGNHMISDVIRLCSGRNVFSELKVLAPQVSTEAVIKADPEVIIASGAVAEHPEWLKNWKKWRSIQAVKHRQLYALDPDIIQRQTMRLLMGATQLCAILEDVRKGSAKK